MKKRDCSWLWFIISLAIMLIFRLLPVPSGLTASGMQVLGILVGAIILWLTLGTTWTSAFVLFALCTVDSLTVASVYSNSFGNTTVVLMVFCYMLAACLVTSGVARRIAVSNKIARKSPWGCVAMFLAAVFVLNSLLPSSAGILVTLPILDEMLLEVGCQKNKATALTCFMALGCVVMGVIANGANPIAHAKEQCRENPAYVNSMTQDVCWKKLPTEIDMLTGALSEQGRIYGVPTPTCDLLTLIISAIQNNYDKQI